MDLSCVSKFHLSLTHKAGFNRGLIFVAFLISGICSQPSCRCPKSGWDMKCRQPSYMFPFVAIGYSVSRAERSRATADNTTLPFQQCHHVAWNILRRCVCPGQTISLCSKSGSSAFNSPMAIVYLWSRFSVFPMDLLAACSKALIPPFPSLLEARATRQNYLYDHVQQHYRNRAHHHYRRSQAWMGRSTKPTWNP